MRIFLTVALLGLPATLAAQAPVSADTPGTNSAGTSYTQPKDWTATTRGPATIFNAPEANLSIAVVNAGKAAGSEAAARQAWEIYKPAAKRKVRLVTAAPPGEGWDERVSIAYDTSPSEKAVVAALALRKGDNWTVMIAEGAEATFGKRSAAASLIQQSLRPAGYARESFKGKTAHRLTPERIQVLRDFVTDSARTLGVPGVGLALIDQGKVVWQGGVGVRELGSSEPVTESTKFMVASLPSRNEG